MAWAAEMIRRRGAQRCMNVECDGSSSSTTSDYCPSFQDISTAHGRAVQKGHNATVKGIQALWKGAANGALANIPRYSWEPH
jgi:hypothetical protein